MQYFTLIGGFAPADLITNVISYFVGLAIYHLIFRWLGARVKGAIYVVVIAGLVATLICAVVRIVEIQDVLTINPSNKVLYALIGTKVNELPNAINTLEIGKMMGYEYDADKGYWVDGLGDKVSGIEGKLAGLKVSDLSSGGIESLTFVLGDVLDESALSSGAFALIDCTGYDSVADIPVSKLSGALTSGINKATYFELVTYGIISAVNNEATLDKLFLTKKEDGAPVFTSTTESHAYWTGLTVTALMNEVVDLIGSYIS